MKWIDNFSEGNQILLGWLFIAFWHPLMTSGLFLRESALEALGHFHAASFDGKKIPIYNQSFKPKF